MALSWGARRQFLYYSVGAVVLIVLAVVLWQTVGTTSPTCSDGIQNGNEEGVDCGGGCALVCREHIQTPVLLWKSSFRTSPSTYVAAAYVQNNNVNSGAHKVAYTFKLYDDRNSLVASQDGVADIPPVHIVPILSPNIPVGERSVLHTQFSFTNFDPTSWVHVDKTKLTGVHVVGIPVLSPDGSRLAATVTNDTSLEVDNVALVAVLFDAQGAAQAISKSTLETLSPHDSQDVVFTWSGGTPGVVRAEITVLPSF